VQFASQLFYDDRFVVTASDEQLSGFYVRAPICLSQWTPLVRDASKAATDKPCHFLYEFRHFVYSASTLSHIVCPTIPPKALDVGSGA
jgi:hypothetical protein